MNNCNIKSPDDIVLGKIYTSTLPLDIMAYLLQNTKKPQSTQPLLQPLRGSVSTGHLTCVFMNDWHYLLCLCEGVKKEIATRGNKVHVNNKLTDKNAHGKYTMFINYFLSCSLLVNDSDTL